MSMYWNFQVISIIMAHDYRAVDQDKEHHIPLWLWKVFIVLIYMYIKNVLNDFRLI